MCGPSVTINPQRLETSVGNACDAPPSNKAVLLLKVKEQKDYIGIEAAEYCTQSFSICLLHINKKESHN